MVVIMVVEERDQWSGVQQDVVHGLPTEVFHMGGIGRQVSGTFDAPREILRQGERGTGLELGVPL